MSHIHASTFAKVPFEQVPALAKRFVATLPENRHGESVVELRATIGTMTVERDALMTIIPSRRYPGYEIMEISWHARNDGHYPVFIGTLAVEQEDLDFCRLDLDGAYAPPGGLAGLAFDAVIGHHIAESVAQELLARLKTAFEELAAPQPVAG